jgi:ANTAR domain-containing protein
MSAARAAHGGNAIMSSGAAQPDRSSRHEVRGDRQEQPASQESGAPVARRTATGWRVGGEEVPDLTSAMVLADLLASELPTQTMPAVGVAPPAPPATGRPRHRKADHPDPEKLEQTVAQLEHALSARVRVEQAIGVLAERHRLRPRQAFELLRSAARSRGQRVFEIATEVVDSATNPLLRIPDELAKPPVARRRGRIARHGLGSS